MVKAERFRSLQRLKLSFKAYQKVLMVGCFQLNAPAVSANFDRARKKAELVDLHVYDLRHTAITALSKKLPNVLELSAVSGHKELRMLKRYHHPDPVELAKKLG